VHWGTRPEQRSWRVRLDQLGVTPLEPPVTLVIGAVARLEVDWYEGRPLWGRRVVVTRAQTQASALSARLQDLGAIPIEVPTIRIDGPADGGAGLDRAAADLADGRYDWVVFSSANAVTALLAHLADARSFGPTRVAAMGPGTADALAATRIVPDLTPERAIAEGLLEAFPDPPGPGSRVLLPRAAAGRDVLPAGLLATGYQVDAVEAYRTVPVRMSDGDRAAVAAADAVCLASASAVRGLLGAVGGPEVVPAVVVCIGPSTAAAATEAGLRVTAVAEQHTIPGLVDALLAVLS
jgi:uroporphyrinogen III methyltransferase/synthase